MTNAYEPMYAKKRQTETVTGSFLVEELTRMFLSEIIENDWVLKSKWLFKKMYPLRILTALHSETDRCICEHVSTFWVTHQRKENFLTRNLGRATPPTHKLRNRATRLLFPRKKNPSKSGQIFPRPFFAASISFTSDLADPTTSPGPFLPTEQS
jgi:hypothetical protein